MLWNVKSEADPTSESPEATSVPTAKPESRCPHRSFAWTEREVSLNRAMESASTLLGSVCLGEPGLVVLVFLPIGVGKG